MYNEIKYKYKSLIFTIKKHKIHEHLKNRMRKFNIVKKYGYHFTTKWSDLLKNNYSCLHVNKIIRFSVVLIIEEFNKNGLNKSLKSVIKQNYKDFDIIILCPLNIRYKIEPVLTRYNKYGFKLNYITYDKCITVESMHNVVDCTNKNDYLMFLKCDDLISKDAFWQIAKSLQSNKPDIVYTDEDNITWKNIHLNPHYKPDFSVDLLFSYNYINNLLIIKKRWFSKIVSLQNNMFSLYDFLLRSIENKASIFHIDKVLYHNRLVKHKERHNIKLFNEDNTKFLLEYFNRVGLNVDIGCVYNKDIFRVKYSIINNPLLSIIILNQNHYKDLKTCLDSIMSANTYKNFEIIIVENNSTEKAILEYYQEIKNIYSNITILKIMKKFNFAAFNNYASRYAKGEYLLFLNNDTQMINSDAISELISVCMRSDVGVVGAKLLYRDNTIQHGGVILGFEKAAYHAFQLQDDNLPGYHYRPHVVNNYSAVTGACLMTNKDVYLEVGGFSEEFRVCFNDVDYCLKVLSKGYNIVYNPFSVWYHDESKTRFFDKSINNKNKWTLEKEKLLSKWSNYFEKGDPYYNKNFINERFEYF